MATVAQTKDIIADRTGQSRTAVGQVTRRLLEDDLVERSIPKNPIQVSTTEAAHMLLASLCTCTGYAAATSNAKRYGGLTCKQLS
jgi:DNA-binding MarR family transcriptional regulator